MNHTLQNVRPNNTYEKEFKVRLWIRTDASRPQPDNADDLLSRFMEKVIFVGMIVDLGANPDDFVVEVEVL